LNGAGILQEPYALLLAEVAQGGDPLRGAANDVAGEAAGALG